MTSLSSITSNTSLASLPLYAPPPPSSPSSSSPSSSSSPFPISPSLNAKLSLHTGKAHTIEADALLLPTNESFTEKSGAAGDVRNFLLKELKTAEKVRCLFCSPGDWKERA